MTQTKHAVIGLDTVSWTREHLTRICGAPSGFQLEAFMHYAMVPLLQLSLALLAYLAGLHM